MLTVQTLDMLYDIGSPISPDGMDVVTSGGDSMCSEDEEDSPAGLIGDDEEAVLTEEDQDAFSDDTDNGGERFITDDSLVPGDGVRNVVERPHRQRRAPQWLQDYDLDSS